MIQLPEGLYQRRMRSVRLEYITSTASAVISAGFTGRVSGDLSLTCKTFPDIVSQTNMIIIRNKNMDNDKHTEYYRNQCREHQISIKIDPLLMTVELGEHVWLRCVSSLATLHLTYLNVLYRDFMDLGTGNPNLKLFFKDIHVSQRYKQKTAKSYGERK